MDDPTSKTVPIPSLELDCTFLCFAVRLIVFFGSPAILVLRGVIRGFSEEARTRGFPSPSLGGFGFVVVTAKFSRKLPDCQIGNVIGTYSSDGNVSFGSTAASRYRISSRAAVRCKAVLEQEFLGHRSLTGSLHPEQAFKLLEILNSEGRKTAKSRP